MLSWAPACSVPSPLAPAFRVNRPACPFVDVPDATSTSPESPPPVFPERTLIWPLPSPPSDPPCVSITISPLCPPPDPLTIRTPPPSTEAAEAAPADSNTSDPRDISALPLRPEIILTSPAAPSSPSPDRTWTLPLEPAAVLPDRNVTAPEDVCAATPPSAELSSASPVEAPED